MNFGFTTFLDTMFYSKSLHHLEPTLLWNPPCHLDWALTIFLLVCKSLSACRKLLAAQRVLEKLFLAVFCVQDSLRGLPIVLASARRTPPVAVLLSMSRRDPPDEVLHRKTVTMRTHARQGDPFLFFDWYSDPPQEVRFGFYWVNRHWRRYTFHSWLEDHRPVDWHLPLVAQESSRSVPEGSVEPSACLARFTRLSDPCSPLHAWTCTGRPKRSCTIQPPCIPPNLVGSAASLRWLSAS